jgi:hypothetical protein
MPMSANARAIYDHLVRVVVPGKRVITYGELSQAQGVI